MRTAEGCEGVTGAIIRGLIRVGGRSPGGLQALLGAPMAVYDGPGGKMRTEDTEGTARGPGWREFAGTFGCAVGSSRSPTAPSGREWNGSQSGQGATELGFPGPALGKMQGEAAGRAGDSSGEGEEPPPQGLGGHHLLAQTGPRCPTGQVMRHHLYRQPGAVGGRNAPTACGSARRRT